MKLRICGLLAIAAFVIAFLSGSAQSLAQNVYIAEYNTDGSGTVSVINTANDTVTATIPVGNKPTALGIFIQPAPNFVKTPRKGKL